VSKVINQINSPHTTSSHGKKSHSKMYDIHTRLVKVYQHSQHNLGYTILCL